MPGESDPSDSDSFDQRLKRFAEQLRHEEEVPPVTVRELLRWRGWQRRGSFVNFWIQQSLNEAKLTTTPDFRNAYIDALIEFRLADEVIDSAVSDPTSPEVIVAVDATTEEVNRSAPLAANPTYRIERLRSTNVVPTAVTPNQSLTEAITIMLANDFSQLPVMIGEREVKGVISWTSIGSRMVLGMKFKEARECMETAHIIPADTPLLNAITEIVNNQYVLVRDDGNKISGIVTTSDLSREFQQLTEPFVILGEIENHVRNLIQRGKFTIKQLTECCDPGDSRHIDGVFDLAFGEYLRLLEKKELWSKLDIAIDRAVFVKKLEKIREIRNNVMHFDPDGITETELDALRKFVVFLQKLQPILN